MESAKNNGQKNGCPDLLDAIRGTHLKTGRAWAIKEALRGLWGFSYPKRAEAFFRRWYFWATHSRLNPVIVAAKTLSRHMPNILTYFKHRISNATAEGLNHYRLKPVGFFSTESRDCG
jgi:transposase